MRIGIFTQWYDPEPGPASLPGALARELVSRGHEVQVVTGFPNYPDGKVAAGYRIGVRSNQVLDGVKVRRVALFPHHGSSVVGRVANYGSFAVSALFSGIGAFRHMDAVWVSNSPATIGMPTWALSRVMRVPTVLHVLDLWPDNILSSGLISGGRLSRVMSRIVDRWNKSMYAASDQVAAISPGVVKRLVSRGVPAEKLSFIPMWANEDKFYPNSSTAFRSQQKVPDERVVLLYAGTLGGTQEIDTLVNACEQYPADAQPIDCWIAGSGVLEQSLRVAAQSVRRDNIQIRFLGRIPPSEMSDVMAAADIHYVGLRDDPLSRITMPSKIQATMASGKPMIMAVRGDAEDVVRQSGIGYLADPGSPASVAQAMAEASSAGRANLAQLGQRSRLAYDAEFAVATGADRIEDLLKSAIKARRSRRG